MEGISYTPYNTMQGSFGRVYKNNVKQSVLVMLVLVMLALVIQILFLEKRHKVTFEVISNFLKDTHD